MIFIFWYISWFANKLFTNFLHQFPENGMPMLPVITFIAAGLWQEPSLTPLAWCILQNVMNLSSRSNPNPNLNLMSLNGDVPVLKLLNHSKTHQSNFLFSKKSVLPTVLSWFIYFSVTNMVLTLICCKLRTQTSLLVFANTFTLLNNILLSSKMSRWGYESVLLLVTKILSSRKVA